LRQHRCRGRSNVKRAGLDDLNEIRPEAPANAGLDERVRHHPIAVTEQIKGPPLCGGVRAAQSLPHASFEAIPKYPAKAPVDGRDLLVKIVVAPFLKRQALADIADVPQLFDCQVQTLLALLAWGTRSLQHLTQLFYAVVSKPLARARPRQA
jgi:hypothetical protein